MPFAVVARSPSSFVDEVELLVVVAIGRIPPERACVSGDDRTVGRRSAQLGWSAVAAGCRRVTAGLCKRAVTPPRSHGGWRNAGPDRFVQTDRTPRAGTRRT